MFSWFGKTTGIALSPSAGKAIKKCKFYALCECREAMCKYITTSSSNNSCPDKVVVENTAFIHSTAKVGENTYVGHFVYIGPDVQIGDGCEIHAHCTVTNCDLGNRVVLNSGTRVGQVSKKSSHN